MTILREACTRYHLPYLPHVSRHLPVHGPPWPGWKGAKDYRSTVAIFTAHHKVGTKVKLYGRNRGSGNRGNKASLEEELTACVDVCTYCGRIMISGSPLDKRRGWMGTAVKTWISLAASDVRIQYPPIPGSSPQGATAGQYFTKGRLEYQGEDLQKLGHTHHSQHCASFGH